MLLISSIIIELPKLERTHNNPLVQTRLHTEALKTQTLRLRVLSKHFLSFSTLGHDHWGCSRSQPPSSAEPFPNPHLTHS